MPFVTQATASGGAPYVLPTGGPPGPRGPVGPASTVPGPPGPIGEQGPAGAGAILSRTASVAIPAWTAVVADGVSGCIPADPFNPAHRGFVLGVTAAGAPIGGTVAIQSGGDLYQAVGGFFTANSDLFVGARGALVATPPASTWRQIVAKALQPNHIVVALGEAEVLAADDALLLPGGLATRATADDAQAGTANDRYLTPAVASALPVSSATSAALDQATSFTFPLPQVMRRTIDGVLRDRGPTPFDFSSQPVTGNWNLSGDWTAAVQACLDQSVAAGLPAVLTRSFPVQSVTARRGASIISLTGELKAIGVGPANSINALLDMPDGIFNIIGRLSLNGQYNLAYRRGAHNYGQQVQYSFPANLAINAFQVGYTHGSLLYPYGIASESTVRELYTYGCPICVEVIGTETIITFMGCPLISDTFGAPNSWSLLPRRVVRSIGAAASFIGGQACITDTINGYIAEMRPLDSGRPTIEGCRYGEIRFNGTAMETASPWLLVVNPDNLAVSQPSSRALFQFDNNSGYVGHDGAMSYITAGAPIDIIHGAGNRFYYPGGQRTQPAWFTDDTSGSVNFYFPAHFSGMGFRDPLAEVVNGVVHWEGTRTILRAGNPGAQSITAKQPSTLRFAATDPTGGLVRYSPWYNPANGRFTAGVGGLADVMAIGRVQFAMPANGVPVTGRIIIVDQAGVERGSAPIGSNVGTVPADVGPMAQGEWISVVVVTDVDAVTTSDSSGGGYLSRLTVKANN